MPDEFDNQERLNKMMNYLKRRFSSGDLQNEHDESVMSLPTGVDPYSRMPSNDYSSRQTPWQNKSSSHTSAPSSPTRSLSFANQFMSVARGVVNQAIQQIPHQGPGAGLNSSSFPHQQPHHHSQINSHVSHNRDHHHQQISKEKCKLLLVIDDQHTDWYD